MADPLGKAFELYIRVRAFLQTLSYVSVTQAGWFPFQPAMQATELILPFITAEYEGRIPPVRFSGLARSAIGRRASE